MKLLLLITGILFILPCYAQYDFRNGFIITNENDTVYGLVDYRGSTLNAKICSFKLDEQSEVIKYEPDQIKGYRYIDSKLYVSKSIPNNEKLFFEYLIDGVVDIFYYRDNEGDHYFIDKGDGKLVALQYKDIEVEVNKQRYIQRKNDYQNVLKYIFKDSEKANNKIDNVSLNHKSLINITKDYHNDVCKDEECIIFEKKISKIVVSIGPLVGFQLNSAKHKGILHESLFYLEGSKFNYSINPTLGLFIKTGIPYVNEKIKFQYDIRYNSWNITTTNYIINGDWIGYEYIKLSQSSISNRIALEYEFPKGYIRPYLQSGIFYNLILNSNLDRHNEYQFKGGTTTTINNKVYPSILSGAYGFSFSMGANFPFIKNQKAFLSVEYQIGNEIRPIKFKLQSHNFGLHAGIPLIFTQNNK